MGASMNLTNDHSLDPGYQELKKEIDRLNNELLIAKNINTHLRDQVKQFERMPSLTQFKEDLRNTFIEYVKTEGCSCCEDRDPHKQAKDKMGELLNFPKYTDKDEYNFNKIEY